jgi:uncharacterized delta-60 repeat protein
MHVIVAFALLVLLGLSNFAIRVQAGGGDLDSTFNGTGKVTTHFLSDDRAFAVATQADGKIIAAGQSLNGSHNDFALVRYNTNGSLDTSFGLGGQVITRVGNTNDFAKGVAIQSDGKIVVVGYSLNGGNKSDFAVVRYNADGLLDSSFGSGGKVTTQVGNSTGAPRDDEAYAVSIQTDGKIIVAGTAVNNSTYYDFALVRYNTNGLLDTAFGSGGIVTTAVGLHSDDDRAHALALQPDGKIVAAGDGGGSYGDFAVVRYNTNGVLDTSFGLGGTGIVTTPIGSYYDRGQALAIQADGKIVVAGHYTTNSFGEAVAVVRYNTNGSLDATFGSGGKVTTEIGIFSYAYAVAIQSDGKIVAVGYNSAHFVVVRYRTDGSLDTSFGSGGIVTTAIGASDQANAVAIQPDGKIVAAGYASVSITGNDFAVVRYDGTSTPAPPQRPLIFIPGITGSYLNRASDGSELWPGLLTFHDGLSLDPDDPITDVIASGAIRQVTFLGIVTQIYGPLLDALANAGYRPNSNPPTLFVFPYDWRKSNADNAIALKNFIVDVRAMHSGSDVDIVAHSMGGMLAQRYILDNPNGSHHVAKLITIATPWLGAPKVVNTLETGEFFDGISNLIVMQSTLKKLVEFFPGAHELIPTPRYFDLGGHPFKEAGWDINHDGSANQDYTFRQMYDLLNQRHPRSLPATNGLSFHNKAGQDGWIDGNDGTGVQYYHLYGFRSGADTIGTVIATRLCLFTLSRQCIPVDYLDVQPTMGDHTVPLISAKRIGNGKRLNANGAVLKLFAYNNNANDDVDHVGLVRNSKVHDAVIAVLNAPLNSQLTQESDRPKLVADDPVEPPAQTYYYVKLRGVATVTITDSQGTSITPSSGQPTIGLSDVTTYVLGNSSLLAILPRTDIYNVVLTAGNMPLAIEIRVGTDLQTSRAVRYSDLNLPTGVKAMLRISPSGPEGLLFDSNGDGTFETSVNPSADLSGTPAQDVDPPLVTFAQTQQQSNVLIGIASSDSGSGVKSTYYSEDGASYQPYTGPFTVNPYQGPVIFAFADDNAANRSGLVTYYPSISSNEIDNATFFVRQHYYDFLSREPDPGGLGFWRDEIIRCGADPICLVRRRVGVSAAFFIELEFQKTGSFVYRSYKGGLGRQPNFTEFSADRPQVVDGPTLEQTKQAFMLAFVQRPEFVQKYASQTTATAFVDALIATIQQSSNVNLSDQRTALISKYGDGSTLNASRAFVVRAAVDSAAFTNAEFNPSFVLMQYFGYLRRDPDPGGYQFWLDVLNNRVPGNFQGMVCAFITSAEYQRRFSSVIPHTDAECGRL